MDNTVNISTPVLPSFEGINNVYFIGIGGIGMSALARYCRSKGMNVAGYDRISTPLTQQLEAEGISVHYTEDAECIDKHADLVVYTPAIPSSSIELAFFRENGYKVVKRSDVLQAISAGSFNICIGGTHGKTTISTMVAHILRHSGYGCNAFLGGISTNYNTNFWSSDRNICVIEADEYDRSFLKLSPDIAIISAMDADHLDIYGDAQSVEKAFIGFGNAIRKNGMLISRFGLKRISEIDLRKKLSYSLQNDAADVYATDIRMEMGGYSFNANVNRTVVQDIHLHMGGMHNIENVLAAITVAVHLQIDSDKIRAAVADFKGVKRRFEYILPPSKQAPGAYVQPVLIDDYAHHPEELRALLKSVRALFPDRVLTVIFQPHLFSRTKDLAQGFREVLGMADHLVLLPIYPARELPVEGVSSEMLLADKASAQVLSKEALLEWLKERKIDMEFGEVVVMAGAGDIDALVEPVKNLLLKK